jgi:hypothetical protein
VSTHLQVVRVARRGYSEMTRPGRLAGVTSPVRRSLVVLSEPTHLGEAGTDMWDTDDRTGAVR